MAPVWVYGRGGTLKHYILGLGFIFIFRFNPIFSASTLIFSVLIYLVLPRRKVFVSLQRNNQLKRIKMKYTIDNVSKTHLNNKVLQNTVFFAAVKLSAKGLFCENDIFEIFTQGSIFRDGPTWFGGFYIIRDGKRIKQYFSFYNDLNLCSVEIYPNGKTNLLEHN